MIGVFGGTFDPPHIGHHILAVEAGFQLNLQKTLWALTGDPPHKPGTPISPVENRLALLQAAIQDHPEYELSRVDVDRPGPHYSVDALRTLKSESPADEFAFLMGSDSLRDLLNWHAPQRFVQECDRLVVMPRPEVVLDLQALERSLPGLADRVVFLQAPLVTLSGSDIRSRVRSGAPFHHLVLPAVAALIDELGLYR